jgi:multidrug efflux system outer membrane protein
MGYHRVIGIGLICGLLTACPALPGAKSKGAAAGMKVPDSYRSGRAAVPELVDGLGEVFADSGLRKQMRLAQKNNPDLAVAAARLEESGFNTRRATAGFFPSLTGNAGAGRSNSPAAAFGAGVSNRYNASLDVQWEVDVWGRIRSGAAAAGAERDAVEAEYAAASQSIAAQTAQAWFNLVASTKLRGLAEARLASFQDTVNLVERRFELGTADLGELSLAKTDVENARSEINAQQDLRDQSARRLAALVGKYPDAGIAATEWPSLKRGVAAGLPSTLLELRPDIYAAYMRIIAADANVKVAHRDLFPQFSLTASGGQQSSALSQLAKSNFSVWSIAANLSAPVLDGGKRRAELGAANARAKQAFAAYHSTVLNAFREVENALGSELYLGRQEQATSQALAAARTAEERTLRNYESGLVEILSVLEAKRRRFNAEENLINLKNQRFQNRVTLALALGKAY